jgi:hypothetical protein
MRKHFLVFIALMFLLATPLSGCDFADTVVLFDISITSEPIKTEYIAGEFFDKTGMVVLAQYDGAPSKAITGYSISPAGALTTEDTFVTVSFGGKEATQAITVNPSAELTAVSVTKAPDKTEYFTGESFDTTGMVVEAVFGDGSSELVTDYTVIPAGSLNAGHTYVTVLYGDKTTRQAITVSAVTLQNIKISRPPTKTAYYEGTAFDPAGMEITAMYDDGSEAVVTGFRYAPDGALTAGTTSIVVTYGDKTVSLGISLTAVDRIEITNAPDKVEYAAGEVFDPTGMVVKAVYEDATETEITAYDYMPRTSLNRAVAFITVLYCGKTAQQPVTVGSASVKRGVGYNFTTNQTKSTSTSQTAADMDLLMGGKNGIGWFYNWGNSQNATVAAEAAARGLSFVPMAWKWMDNAAENNIRNFVRDNPDCEYILACNEPNLTDQANLTPQEYASDPNGWPRLRAVAAELGLKIISPAMNWGTKSGYGDPIVWLDEFFAQPNVDIADIYALSIHDYSGYPSAVKSFVGKFKKYDKPIWLTEFCAWNKDGNLKDEVFQMRYMSQTCAYLELEPLVERYAWFIPKGAPTNSSDIFPYNKLLKKTNPVQLTNLGIVYTNMSVCNQSLYLPAGVKMDAAQFSGNNISDNLSGAGWTEAVSFRPTADTDRTAGVLDIHSFKSNMWVEYLVDVEQAGDYTLDLRYQTASTTNMSVTIDGGTAKTAVLSSAAWTNTTVNLGSLSKGMHTLRLRVTSGECALNWLRLISTSA